MYHATTQTQRQRTLNPYRKGDWVLFDDQLRPMRVQRDPAAPDRLDAALVWCEWMDGGYHLEAHDVAELVPMPPEAWPLSGPLD